MDEQTPGTILAKFYAENHLDADGGIKSPYVEIGVGKIFSIYFPNFNARRKAVPKHDIHHIVTGYPASSFLGEAEISAWEIGSGCRTYWAAFVIDVFGVLLGLWINPWKVFSAFARGRKTLNLYHDTLSREEEMNKTVTEIKAELLLDRYPKKTRPSFIDFCLFIVLIIFGMLSSMALSVFLILVIIIYSIYISAKKKKS